MHISSIYTLDTARFMKDKPSYTKQVEKCVQDSKQKVYHVEQQSSLKFTPPIPAHEKLKQTLLDPLQATSP